MAEAEAEAASVPRRLAYLKGVSTKHVEMNIALAAAHIQTGEIDNPGVYSKTCMKLGSSIDSAIGMNVVPSSSHIPQLLWIVKAVYTHKTEVLQPSLMLLMLPIKAACQVGWFPEGDKDDLFMMAKEISCGFSRTDKMSIEPSHAHSSVTNIVSRFYPTMKVENILTSFDVKAGYGTFVTDFHISLGTTPRHCRNLWLLVARLDNMDTAACIANPLNVDFLVNGSEVPKRTKSDMGKGPQLPSNLTKMIKYGVNLIQVFGNFDGQYIIAIAFMNLISSPDHSQLQDHLHPFSGAVGSDSNVMEVSSHISLDCPLSQNRIKVPVKGHLCNHPQCFDYKCFMEINSAKPTWECPLCNKPVCNQDIRIDQGFLKILNEVAEDVSEVIISADGSWVAAETNRDTMPQSNHVSDTVGDPISTSSLDLDNLRGSDIKSTRGQTQVNACTTKDAQRTTVFTPAATSSPHAVALAFEELRKGGEQGSYTTPGESQPPPNISAVSPTQLPETMPSGRMRGSLKGDELEAARLRFLAPPPQLSRANQPWSKPPPPSLPLAFTYVTSPHKF